MFKRDSVSVAISIENPRRYLRIAIRPAVLRNLLVLVTLVIGALALLVFSPGVAAVNRTWDGGGVTNNWSEAANWSGDVAPNPLGGDVAIFDGTNSKNVTIDVAVIVSGFQINSPYIGEISQGSSSVTVNGASSQSSGTFTGGSGLIDFNNSFTLSGGTFTASSTTTSFGIDFTQTGGTFAPNGGTVVFDGGNVTTIDVPASLTLNNVTVNKTGGGTVNIQTSDTLVVAGTLTLTDGPVNGAANATLEAQGDVAIASTFNGGTVILLISGAATRTVILGAGVLLPRLTVNAPNVTVNTSGAGAVTFTQPVNIQSVALFTNGTGDFIFNVAYTQTAAAATFTGGSGLIDFNNSFTLSGGTFTASSTTTSFGIDFTQTGGTFAPNGGTVVFDGGNAATIDVPTSLTLNNVTVNKSSSVFVAIQTSDTLVVAGTLTLTNSVVNGAATLEAQGDVAIASTFDGGTINLLISGAATRTVILGAGALLPRLTVNAPNVTVNTSGAGAVTFTQPVNIQSVALFTNGTVDFIFNVAYTHAAATFTGGSGLIDFNTFFTLSGGTFTASSTTTSFGTDFTQTGGTFAPNGGTVVFDGGNAATIDVPTSLTLNNVTVNKSGSVFVAIQTNDTLVVAGTLTLTNSVVNGAATLEAQGDVAIASTFNGGTVNFRLSGSANQTYTNGGGLNVTGAWTVNKPSGAVALASNLILNSNQPLTITSGTLDQGTSFNLQTSALLTVGLNGILRNFGGGDLILGGNLTNNGGIINFNDGGTNCGDANGPDPLQIRSTNTTQRTWSGSGTLSLVDVDVDTQTVGATPGTITAFGASTLNNTTNWTLNSGCPVEITQPPVNQSGCPGGSAGFTVNADGTGLTFGWRKGVTPLANGGNISIVSGPNTSTLTINPVGAGDAGSYDVLVTSSLGITATSNPATLSLFVAPSVATNPVDSTVCEGALASFTAAANGDPAPTVQWQVSTDGGVNFNDILGATSTTLSFTASASQNGNKYRAVFTNSCNTASTSAATLTADGFALSANSQTFTSAGGSGSVDVITGSTCSWTAVSNDSFIQITSGGGGTGNGTVNFTVDPSPSSRTGTMTIAGQTFTVNQSGPTAADGMVSGRILDSNSNPVEGAAVRMSGTQSRLTITDAEGNYRFDNVETSGFYTLTPERVNFTFSPSQRSFSQLGQQTEATFTAFANGGNLNPLDTTEYLVRQQYVDFLGREPDEAGFNFWVNNIEACGADVQCREVVRINTSAAFFLSIEFQQTGYLVYRMYLSAYGNIPGAPVPVRLGEFRPDSQAISSGVVVNKIGWEALLENNKQAFTEEFVQRSRFLTAFPASTTPAQFVDTLNQNAGDPLSQSERDQLVNDLTTGAKTRAQVLRAVAEDPDLSTAEFNRAFVLMQYFGYLRRNPNDAPEPGLNFDGYNFWLNKLIQFNGNFVDAEMVKAFITSGEYRQRFGP